MEYRRNVFIPSVSIYRIVVNMLRGFYYHCIRINDGFQFQPIDIIEFGDSIKLSGTSRVTPHPSPRLMASQWGGQGWYHAALEGHNHTLIFLYFNW